MCISWQPIEMPDKDVDHRPAEPMLFSFFSEFAAAQGRGTSADSRPTDALSQPVCRQNGTGLPRRNFALDIACAALATVAGPVSAHGA